MAKLTPNEKAVLAKWKAYGKDASKLSSSEHMILSNIPHEVLYPSPKDWYRNMKNISPEAQSMLNIGVDFFKAIKQSGVSPKIKATMSPMKGLGVTSKSKLKSGVKIPNPVAEREALRKKQKAENWKQFKRTAGGTIKGTISDVMSSEAKDIYNKVTGNEEIFGYKLPKWFPRLARGGVVKKTGIAQVHAGETVVPQHKSFEREMQQTTHNKAVMQQDKQHHKEQTKKLDEHTKLLKEIKKSLKDISGKGKVKKATQDKFVGGKKGKVSRKIAKAMGANIPGTMTPDVDADGGGGGSIFNYLTGGWAGWNMLKEGWGLAKRAGTKAGGYATKGIGYAGKAAGYLGRSGKFLGERAGPIGLGLTMADLAYQDYLKMKKDPEYAKQVVESGFVSAEGAHSTAWTNANEASKKEKERQQQLINANVKAQEDFLKKNPGEKNNVITNGLEEVKEEITLLGSIFNFAKDAINKIGSYLPNTPSGETAESQGGGISATRKDEIARGLLSPEVKSAMDKEVSSLLGTTNFSCGEIAGKVGNAMIAAAGGKTSIPISGGIAVDTPVKLANQYGSKLRKHSETPFTAVEMSKWAEGTVMAGGSGGEQSHAQIVARNPITGEKGILSGGGGKPVRFKTFEQAEADINWKGWQNWTATNPLEGTPGGWAKQQTGKTPGVIGGFTPERQTEALKSIKYYTDRGIPLEKALQMVANHVFEGGGYNPNAVNPTSGAFGTMQVLGGRRKALQKLAAAMGLPENSMEVQRAYPMYELETNPYEAKKFSQFLQSGPGAGGVAAYSDLVERPGKAVTQSSLPGRMAAYNKLKELVGNNSQQLGVVPELGTDTKTYLQDKLKGYAESTPKPALNTSSVQDALNVNRKKEEYFNRLQTSMQQQNNESLANIPKTLKEVTGQQNNIVMQGGAGAASSNEWPPIYFVDDMLAWMSVTIFNSIRG